MSICYKTNNASVPHRTNDDGTITIIGENIIDDIVIVINSALTEIAVTVDGNAASDAVGYTPTAKIGEAYTLTVNQDDKYSYTVTATVGEQAIVLTVANNTYTSPADSITTTAGSITFTVTKTLKTEVVTATP